MKIAVMDAKEYDIESLTRANRDYGMELRFFYDRLNCPNADLARGCEAVCVFVNDRLSEETLTCLKASGIKLVLLRCAGVNNVDIAAAKRLGITVANAPEYSPEAIAEHTMALILTLNRKIHKAYNRTREYNFSLRGLMGFNMRGKTVGVLGLGRIGKASARLLAAFGCEVIAYDSYPDEEYAMTNGIKLVDFDELCRRSDIITLHCPLTNETRHMINEKSIALMKQGVMIVNTSRGGLIDTHDLLEGVKAGRISGVGLDVYEEEERYFYEDHTDSVMQDDVLLALLAMPNVIVTSHQAYFTHESMESIARITLENALAFEQGREPVGRVK